MPELPSRRAVRIWPCCSHCIVHAVPDDGINNGSTGHVSPCDCQLDAAPYGFGAAATAYVCAECRRTQEAHRLTTNDHPFVARAAACSHVWRWSHVDQAFRCGLCPARGTIQADA